MKLDGKRGIIKNLISLAFGHFLVFTAFDSLSNLQSTVNEKDGVGIASQSVIYAFFTVSSFFLPTYFIKRFGCKRTLVLSVFSICPYVAANYHPHWGTLIPSAVLAGLAFGPLWAARSTYVNEISFSYSRFGNVPVHVVNAWFFGIYSFFHENAEIWGNVISYAVLKNPHSNETSVVQQQCGAAFCGSAVAVQQNPNLLPPSDGQRYSLTSIYLVFVLTAGFVIMVLLDPLEREEKSGESTTAGLSTDLLIATLKHMKNKNQLLLLPLSFYCGLADGFYNSDYTKSYVACGWGISAVGFVTMFYGIVSAVVDLSSGFLVKCLTRVPVFLLAAASHFAMFATLLLYSPDAHNFTLFFALSGVYGVGASVWWSQITAFYGVIFKADEEAAFSNFYFWSSLGFSVAYAYSDALCTRTKLAILLALLFASMVSYVAVDWKFTCRSRCGEEGDDAANRESVADEKTVNFKDEKISFGREEDHFTDVCLH